MIRQIFILSFLFLTVLTWPLSVFAQAEVYEEYRETVPAEVVEITRDEDRVIAGLDTTVRMQEVRVSLKDGRQVSFINEITPLEVGDKIFIDRRVTIQGQEYYVLKDVDRRFQLALLTSFLIIFVIWFAGRQGVRALLSLGASIGGIVFLLVPALLAGYDPALASLVISSGILAVVLFGTHGFGPVPRIAFAGTFTAVLVTSVVAYIFVYAMRFTGISSDEAIFLNFATGGSLDFAGLLLGGIIIGMLGVLDDVSITQSSVTAELRSANPTLSAYELYQRAVRVGRDHVGSLVNTLALAYVGVSLPLLLLLSRAESSLTLTLNQEIVAVEITRIIIGSLGIVMAVPFTTILSALYFSRQAPDTIDVHSHHYHH